MKYYNPAADVLEAHPHLSAEEHQTVRGFRTGMEQIDPPPVGCFGTPAIDADAAVISPRSFMEPTACQVLPVTGGETSSQLNPEDL